MKSRILGGLLLALLALSTLVPLAQSDQVSGHFVVSGQGPLMFRTTGLYATLLALDPQTKRGSGTTGYVDSVGYCRSGSAPYDTTAPIPLIGLAQSHQVSGAVGPDTTLLGRLIISEAGGLYANGPQGILKGLDSIYVSVEV